MRAGRRGFLAAAAVALAGFGAEAGCAELPEIGDNVCGNSIVETSEDCDTFAPSGLRCRAAGAAGECRWDCTVAEDGTRPSCPTGSGCGADGICRTPTGRFAPAGEPIPARAFAAGDFDADSRIDLVSFDGTNVAVRFYEQDGTVAKTNAFSASVEDRAPAFGDLTGDGKSDAVIHLADIGLGVLTASADRTLSPVVQATIDVPLPNDGSRLIGANVLADAPGDETMALLSLGGEGFGVLALNQQDNAGQATLLFELPPAMNPLDIAGEIPTGDFDNDPARPCPELVVGSRLDDRVRVYTPCADSASYLTDVVPHQVALPPSHTISGAIFVGDANGDELLDILVPVDTGDLGPALDVAFGVGDGTFHSDPTAIPSPGAGDDTASLVLTLYRDIGMSSVATAGAGSDPVGGVKDGPLLAVGDVNGDGRVDLVTSSQLYLSAPSGPTPAWFGQGLGANTSWTAAGIADFNGNGYVDVIGASSDVAGLDFLNGAGDGLFNHFDVPTQRPVSRLALGDFDGDLLTDLAFAEVAGSDGQQTLAFCFGRAFGPPEDPVSAGTLAGIAQLVTGDRLLSFLLGGGAPDAMSELAIVSVAVGGESGSLTVVPGSSDRRLQSPYILFGEQTAPSFPLAIAVGQFTGGDRLADLFALGVRVDTFAAQAWLVASEADGKFGDASAVPLEAGELGFLGAWSTVGDLDGPNAGAEPLDEVVMVAPRYLSAEEQALVFVFRADGAGSFEVEAHPVAELLTGLPLGTVARLTDLDGDGFPDLLVRAVAGVVSEGEEPKLNELYVYWNDNGQLDFANPLGLPPLDADFVGSFTTLNVDGDPEQEIVVTGYSGAYLFDGGGAARTFEPGAPLAGVPPGLTAVGGDFNGDGVDDVAVGAFESPTTTVLFGIPVRP